MSSGIFSGDYSNNRLKKQRSSKGIVFKISCRILLCWCTHETTGEHLKRLHNSGVYLFNPYIYLFFAFTVGFFHLTIKAHLDRTITITDSYTNFKNVTN